ncbi:hypothetical protein Pla175_33130 [Pirellulimonas nuda]|uniref:Fimbrial assembly protein (PilN) n=1 Tax=Pirellulimonas nuda TaxID=2528009 RepID=A0A518DEM4_9BACT|nr:PilN domain-containing protein [Pirellulimonas nuda]QDU89916.1 hypothetical protein Pla175_33130 [Pirellulimonas nuda]
MSTSNTDRRGPDRRHAGERRRQADNRHVYLELGRQELRALVIVERGEGQKDIAITRTVRWGEEAEAAAEYNWAALAQAVKQVTLELRLNGGRATVLLPGQMCVTRVATGSKQSVDRELNHLRERTQLYLSLGAGPKALALGRSDLDARNEHALLSVASSRNLHAVIEAVEAGGLAVVRIESALVALSRLHLETAEESDDPTVLLQLDPVGVEIGLLRNGRLLLDYRPSGATTPTDLFRLLDEHRNRLLRLCQRQAGQSSATLSRVLATGDPGIVAAASKAGRTRPSWSVSAIDAQPIASATWELKSDELGAEFAALTGAALPSNARLDALPRPNLMDQIIADSRAPMRPVLLRSLAPLAATLLVWLTSALLLQGYESRVDGLRAELAALAPLQTRSTLLKTELFAADAKLAQLTSLSEAAPTPQLTLALERVAGCLPGDVWLDQVHLEGTGDAIVGGASYSDSSAYDFVRYLQEAPDLDEVALRGTRLTNTPEGPATSFDVHFQLAPGKPANPEAGT